MPKKVKVERNYYLGIKREMISLKKKGLIEILDNLDYPHIHALQITDLGLKLLLLSERMNF